jgi:hypothetical protein
MTCTPSSRSGNDACWCSLSICTPVSLFASKLSGNTINAKTWIQYQVKFHLPAIHEQFDVPLFRHLNANHHDFHHCWMLVVHPEPGCIQWLNDGYGWMCFVGFLGSTGHSPKQEQQSQDFPLLRHTMVLPPILKKAIRLSVCLGDSFLVVLRKERTDELEVGITNSSFGNPDKNIFAPIPNSSRIFRAV